MNCKKCNCEFEPIKGFNGIIKSRVCNKCLSEKKEFSPINKMSEKLKVKISENSKLKLSISYHQCFICGKGGGSDLIHLVPKSLFPEYYTAEWNLKIGHRDCHEKYDNDLVFRQKQTHIFNYLLKYDELAARRYFKIYE